MIDLDWQQEYKQLLQSFVKVSETAVKLSRIATEASQEAARLRAMLERLEWAGQCDGYEVCAICGRAPKHGHAHNCELDALLKEAAGD